ncbi:MAG: hypothetical protein RL062_5 [Bacteroidota bacterium]
MIFRLFLLGLLLVANLPNMMGQEKVQLVYSDNIYYSKKLVDAQRVIGNVHFEREGNHLYCDSAYWYDNRDFKAFGKIKIVKPGDYTLTGNELFYRNEENKAYLNGNAVLVDENMTLTAPKMDYQLSQKWASYSGGGKIVSSQKKNTLISQRGTYNTETGISFFEKNVQLQNDQYTLRTEKLKYDNLKEVAHFIAPTTIVSKTERLTCSKGFYQTRTEYCEMFDHPLVISNSQKLSADTIYFNGQAGWGKAHSHVVIHDTLENKWVTGGYGEYHEKEKVQWVTKTPQYFHRMETDTLLLKADTLWMQQDSLLGDRVKAYHSASFFHPDFQGVGDSIVFQSSDSTLHFYKMPILWAGARQITGDSMYVEIKNNNPYRFFVRSNSMIIGQTVANDTSYFDQIKGRDVVGFFQDGQLYRIDIKGNGQLIYFPLEKEDSKAPIGLNKADCSNISVLVKDRKIRQIALKKEPDSHFIPEQQTKGEVKKLKGFSWLEEQRPLRQQFQ